MKAYIFFTSDGFTQNMEGEETENCQILDWQMGNDEREAFNNFKRENPELQFDNICCQELSNDKIFYF